MFIGPVKIKYIAVFSVILDILSIEGGNPGGHIAHLGGALFGYFYIKQLQKGNDLTKGFNRFTDNLISYFYSTKMNVVRPAKRQSKRYKPDEDYSEQKAANQQKMDEILDKISKSGYESLTREEKDILFKISNKN